MKVFKKHISKFEKAAALGFWSVLLLTVITQVFFDVNVLLWLVIIVVLTVTYSLVVFLPEVYEFKEETFSVVNIKLNKSVIIPYDRIIKIDTVGLFRNIKKDFDSAEIIITYKPVGKGNKCTILCHPKNIMAFVKLLYEKCPNLIQDNDDK